MSTLDQTISIKELGNTGNDHTNEFSISGSFDFDSCYDTLESSYNTTDEADSSSSSLLNPTKRVQAPKFDAFSTSSNSLPLLPPPPHPQPSSESKVNLGANGTGIITDQP